MDLLFFYGLECPHCKKMEKYVDRLSQEGFKIEKIEIWHNKTNNKMLEKLDCGEEPCGGVPFFYNNKNGTSICGEVSYKELVNWAKTK